MTAQRHYSCSMSLKPYEISSSILISAPQQKVFDYISELKNFNEWNPFAAMATDLIFELSEVTNAVGSTYSYSDKRMGTGVMTITELHPNTLVRIRMDFKMPDDSVADIHWLLSSSDGATQMTWRMNGERGTKDRIFVAMLGMNRMMAKHFTQGLEALKAKLEA